MITLDDLRLEQVPELLRELALAGQREADLSLAAAQLAELKPQSKTRPSKIFTGCGCDARPSWRRQRVVLPGGHVGVLYRALRRFRLQRFCRASLSAALPALGVSTGC